MPKLLKTPFAADAADGYRTDIQESTGVAPNSATYQIGFPPNTMQSIAAGGMPPKGSDLNGVLYDVTDNLVFLTQGGGYGFDSAYATSIGGYPLNARLRLNDGTEVISTIANNTNDPNLDMTGWKYSVIGQEFKLTEVANSVKRSIKDIIYDQIIDVTWFGAKGDWNTTTQTGTDDTVAIQNAINYYASLGSRRVGGVGAIKFPAGNYRYSSLTLPNSIGFGMSFIGDGQKSTNLWADHNDPNPAIISQIEFVRFHEISLFGALADNIGYTSAKAVGFKGQLSSNGADIDVEFSNCGIFCWNEFANIYGRGFVVNNCAIGLIQTFLNIVCSTDTVFNAGNNSTSSKTGMRHYTMRGNRFDGVGTVLKVTGTGAQKDYINDVMILGNDMLFVDRLIQGDDATIRRSLIGMNNCMMSFAAGIIIGKSFESIGILGNNFAKSYDGDTIPSSAATALEFILVSTGSSHFINVSDNNIKYLKSAPINVGAGSTNIRYKDNDHLQAWETAYGTSATKYVVYSSANIENLIIKGNMFSTATATGTFNLCNGAVQTSKNTRFDDNLAPWRWAESRIAYTPKLLVAGVQSATSPSAVNGRYYCDDRYVYVDVLIAINPAETTGNLAISLPPVTAVAENSGFSSGYGGSGRVHRYSGFTATAGVAMSDIVVNPATQQAELYKVSNMTQSNLTAADRTGSVTMLMSFKYRY